MELRWIELSEHVSQVSSYALHSREEEILPEMNSVRKSFASLLIGKFIYVFGGNSATGCTNACER